MASFSTIRQAIAAKILEISGFKQTTSTPDLFLRTQDTIAHKAFAVGLSNSLGMTERQRRSVGVYVETPITVIFAYQLRPMDRYPTDYDLSLDTEELVINKVLEAYTNKAFTIRYLSSLREVTESEEHIIITLEFTTQHTI